MGRRLLLPLLMVALAAPGYGRTLRICADPNNLPFSNEQEQGFENRLAEMMAKDLGAQVEYTWWAERGPFVRNSLLAGKWDVILGIPSATDQAAVTKPY
jgi:mxaJ protein